ncbi:hypothetical protein AVEN_14143-1 [Araneus ventricosus]|uniref:Uncharacterized protein n=1 Tax=Araneus ventricosus TaxID=182803 RepID=A0A4Y2FZ49_ARAVE|nr:hypothetical protein AVEN_14143-1 [Araneus ventricosus]
MSGDRDGHTMTALLRLGEWCIQKLTNNVAVVWRSAVLLKDDTFWKMWNCIQSQHVKVDVGRHSRLRTVRDVASSPARAPLHYRHSLGYCSM